MIVIREVPLWRDVFLVVNYTHIANNPIEGVTAETPRVKPP